MKRKHLLMQTLALAAAHLLAARAVYLFAPTSISVPPAARHSSLLAGNRQCGLRALGGAATDYVICSTA